MSNNDVNFCKQYTLQDMQQVVKEVVADVLQLPADENPSVNTRLDDDLLADSIDGVEIVMQLEDRLMISIADRDAAQVHHSTIGDVADLALRTYYGRQQTE